MMKKVIPFIGLMSKTDQVAWLEAITPLIHEAILLPYEALTPQDKRVADVAVVANPDPKHIAELPQLKWVQSLWAGVERLLTELPHSEVGIVRMVDPQLALTMAEAVLAWTLYLHRDMPKYLHQQKHKIWHQNLLVETKDRRIGVLGLGHLGRASVKKLLLNGFNVSGWSRHKTTIDGVQCFYGETGLQAMLKQTDILICLLPLTDDTHHLLNEYRLGCLPRSASLINFSRGQIVDHNALLKQLEIRHLEHAVLDVFDAEPLPDHSPLWDSDYLTILPHISAPTTIKTASLLVAKHLNDYHKTGRIPTIVEGRRGY